MPKASDFIQSSTINAETIGDKPVKVKILAVEPETTRDDKTKLGLTFDKFSDRKLLLNTTNLKLLIKAYGDDYTRWVGKSLTLKTESTMYMGEPTVGVRVVPGK